MSDADSSSDVDAALLPLISVAQKEVLETYQRQFEDLTATFRDLDSKAQGTVAIAGIFLAAALAFLDPSKAPTSWHFRGLLLLAVLTLLGTIVFSILALRLRRIASVPSGQDVESALENLSRIDDQKELESRLHFFYGDVLGFWSSSIESRSDVNRDKASYLWRAQRSLVASAVLAGMLIVLAIL